MHIVDGALSTPVVVAGAALAAGGIALGLRRLDMDRMPAAGVLSATFFVASLIHVPIGPSSVHLIMNGLAGIVLGWVAFPALFVGLVLQAVFFGFGGLTVLGVNTVTIALPAVLAALACRRGVTHPDARVAAVWGGLAGALSIALTTAAVALVLTLSGEAFVPAARLVFVAHLPVMAIEGLLTAAAVFLIHRARPDLLGLFTRPAVAGEGA